MEVFAQRAREIMAREGLTLQEVARRAGVSHAAVHGWLTLNDVRLSTLRKLAAALGVEPHELLKPAQDPRQPGEAAQDQGAAARIICPHCGKAVTLFVDK